MKQILTRLKKGYWPAVIAIGLLTTVLNSIAFFLGLLRTPSQTYYLGTIHYYEDFFLYVNTFFQGAHGAWLVANRYTSEITAPSVIYWCNLLMGKIGALLPLRPEMVYNIFVLMLAFSSLIMGFLVLRKLFPKQPNLAFAGFLFSTFATSWMNHIVINNQPVWYPFQLWKTPQFAFDRLGGVPHQLLGTNLFLLLILLFFNADTTKSARYTALAAVTAFSLTCITPYPALLFVAAMWLVWAISLLRFRNIDGALLVRLTVVSLLVAAGSALILYEFTLPPNLQASLWEAQQQAITTLSFLIASMGPVVILAVLGMFSFLKKTTPTYLLAVLSPALAYALFLSPMPKMLGTSNVRFIFPGLYVFLGALAAQGCWVIGQALHHVRATLKPSGVLSGLVLLFLVLSGPTLWWEINQKIQDFTDAYQPLLYLPIDVYRGFQYLSRLQPFDDVAVASSISRMDILVPALSGHTGYSGHMLLTIDAGNKANQAGLLFNLALSSTQARNWLAANRIRYVVFTQYDGDRGSFMAAYPFLRIRYETTAATIFEVPH